MADFGRALRIASYEASDGPRIVMFGPLEVALDDLSSLFRNLSQGSMSVRLEDQPWVRSFGGVRIELISGGQGARFEKLDGEHPVFRWELRQQEWARLAGLVDGVLSADRPGHQYLTRYPDDDAIVVVSKGEYGDDVLA